MIIPLNQARGLVSLLEEGNALIGIGAGVSIETTKGRTHSFAQFVEDGWAFVKELGLPILKPSNVSKSVEGEQIKKILSDKGKFAEWLEKNFYGVEARDDGIYQALAQLKQPLFTANFDTLISMHARLPAATWESVEEAVRILENKDPGVLHLHGIWTQPGSILFGQGFNRPRETLLQNDQVRQTLRGKSGVVTLGMGHALTETDDNLVLDLINRVMEGAGEKHVFALVPKPEAELIQAKLGDLKLDLVTYEHFSDVVDFLGEIKPRQAAAHVNHIGKLNREASEAETCLQAQNYAQNIVDLARQPDVEDFCFGLFGHWGRGKTHLMKRVEKLLANPEGNQKPIESVWFSAWKYPSTPTLWVHFYETLLRKARSGSWWKTFPRTFRANIYRDGVWPLVAIPFLIALSMPGFSDFFKAGWTALQFVSLTTLISSLLLLLKAFGIYQKILSPILRRYTSMKSHREKLGIQAVLGKDLQCLLDGWLTTENLDEIKAKDPSHPLIQNRWTPATACLFLVGSALMAAAIIFFGFNSSALWTLISGIMITPLAFFLLWKRWLSNTDPPKKLAIIIDDLDRCKLDDMLHVIESIKLLLEEPSFKKKLLVFMLVDDRMLRLAILNKHSDLLKDSHKEITIQENRIINENMEKLFLAGLRLPQLSKTEVEEVVTRFLDHTMYPPKEESRGTGKNAAPKEFTFREREAIIKEFRKVNYPWSPRGIRNFMFKYQLCRELMTIRGVPIVVKELVNALRCALEDPNYVHTTFEKLSVAGKEKHGQFYAVLKEVTLSSEDKEPSP